MLDLRLWSPYAGGNSQSLCKWIRATSLSLSQSCAATILGVTECLGFDGEVRSLVTRSLLLGPRLSWNFFMMNYFFTVFLILDIRGTGFSLNTGCCVYACIMLAMKTVRAVASGSTAYGVPWHTRPSWSIHLNLPNSSWILLQGTSCSNLTKSVRGLIWSRKRSRGLGAGPLITMPSCTVRVVPDCHVSMSRR